jgi:hypothetical protein
MITEEILEKHFRNKVVEIDCHLCSVSFYNASKDFIKDFEIADNEVLIHVDDKISISYLKTCKDYSCVWINSKEDSIDDLRSFINKYGIVISLDNIKDYLEEIECLQNMVDNIKSKYFQLIDGENTNESKQP